MASDNGAPGKTATANPSATEVLATTIAAVVEKQLAAQSAMVAKQLAAQQQAHDAFAQGLQSALEQRLQQLAQHQASQIGQIESHIATLQAGVGAGGGGTDRDTEYVDHQIGVLTARLDDASKTVRRFDEQASALVQHVNETTAALSRRMDEGDQALAHAVEQRLVTVREMFDGVGVDVAKQLADNAVSQQSKLDAADSRVTDRMLALEERLKEDAGTKIASLEATVGRIGAGFDEAMIALSQRLLDVENKLLDTTDRLTMLKDQLARVDETAIQEVKDQLSSAIGEAMLVRIELDRVVTNTDSKLDKAAVRMSEIEAKLAEEVDVSAAVQLERLDELERAVVMLDPAKFVRRGDTGAVQVIAADTPRPVERSSPTAPPPAGPISQELQAIAGGAAGSAAISESLPAMSSAGLPDLSLNPTPSGTSSDAS